ncbi:hypothetical protein A9G34_00840 [Gilliamella sp. Choc4-2]|uniref:hypothetical protein n=1 Tax=Gilliamella sp. Choc4-2 TaxID=3120237 RepID=UPI00080E936C|nr:hypothetical protein [Gilliamella apicola]OCG45679.1 hypothetical protein A9G34_00840 [Gilliamella apicola]
MNKKIKEASDLTSKLISDAVKNLQSNNDDYIIDYFDELVSSIKAKLGATQFNDVKIALKKEINIRPDFMSVLDSAIVFARRIIYLNLILKPSTAWRLP